MRTMQMRHMCLWTNEMHDNGHKRGGSDEKVQKLWIILWDASLEQKTEQQSHASRGEEEREQ